MPKDLGIGMNKNFMWLEWSVNSFNGGGHMKEAACYGILYCLMLQQGRIDCVKNLADFQANWMVGLLLPQSADV